MNEAIETAIEYLYEQVNNYEHDPPMCQRILGVVEQLRELSEDL